MLKDSADFIGGDEPGNCQWLTKEAHNKKPEHLLALRNLNLRKAVQDYATRRSEPASRSLCVSETGPADLPCTARE